MLFSFFFNDTATTEIYTLSLHDALPISVGGEAVLADKALIAAIEEHSDEIEIELAENADPQVLLAKLVESRSEEHTSELQSPDHLVCRLLLEKKNKKNLHRHVVTGLRGG